MSATYLVIGFCDVRDKRHGMDDCVLFREEHQWRRKTIPSQLAMRRYATKRGYYPSGKRGAVPGRCDPIYYARSAP
jgi:hypothetical protein